jgi:hypothetical protein
MRFSSARDQAEETRRRHNAAARRALELARPNVRINGEENFLTLMAANNYASSLHNLNRFEEAKALLRKTIPVARRVLGGNHELTLRMRWNYAKALYRDDRATLDDLREAVATLEDTERTARRVLGSAHPITSLIESGLQNTRAALEDG